MDRQVRQLSLVPIAASPHRDHVVRHHRSHGVERSAPPGLGDDGDHPAARFSADARPLVTLEMGEGLSKSQSLI